MSSLMPTNTRRKPSCVETLAKSVISEAEAARVTHQADTRYWTKRDMRSKDGLVPCSRSCKSSEAILGAPRKLMRRQLSFLQLRERRSWTAQRSGRCCSPATASSLY